MPDLAEGLVVFKGLSAALVTPAPGSKGQNPTGLNPPQKQGDLEAQRQRIMG